MEANDVLTFIERRLAVEGIYPCKNHRFIDIDITKSVVIDKKELDKLKRKAMVLSSSETQVGKSREDIRELESLGKKNGEKDNFKNDQRVNPKFS